MSRSGYSEECDGWALIRWRGAVKSAINGERGQAFLRELAAALDAMPEKELAAHSFQTADGEFCTLGVIAHARGLDVSGIDPEDDCRDDIANLLDIAPALAAEIMYENDGDFWPRHEYDGGKRWHYMRKWVEEHLRASGAASKGA